MKITKIYVSDATHRMAKSQAALLGMPMGEFITQLLMRNGGRANNKKEEEAEGKAKNERRNELQQVSEQES